MPRTARLVLIAAATGLGLAAGSALLRERPRPARVGVRTAATDTAQRGAHARAMPDAAATDVAAPHARAVRPAASPVSPGAAPAAQAPDPRTRPVAGRTIFFPASAARQAGALPDLARRLLDEHRDVLGLGRIPGELRVSREETSISGHHLRMRQWVGGVPVEGSEIAAHVAPDGRPVMLSVDAFPVGGVATTPRLSATDAVLAARAVLMGGSGRFEDDTADADAPGPGADAFEHREPELWIRPEEKGGRLVWRVDARTARESARVVLDALDGELVAIRDLRVGADSDARVFNPNPVYSSRNGALRDKRDGYQPALESEMVAVTLHRLDGSGRIRGKWCDAARGDGDAIFLGVDLSRYSRDDAPFELVNAYWHVDQAQERIQALGIKDANAKSQKLSAHALDLDQSYYDLIDGIIRFGDGGVDDAEDGDVVVHEYGHSIQNDLVDDFGATSEGAAIAEGSSDFLACAMHATGDDKWDPLVGSWDATSYSNANPPFLRRVDRSKTYPRSLIDEPHEDGEIWSRFLWDMRSVVGPDDGIRLVIEALRYMTGDSQFRHSANAVLAANIALREGRDDAALRALLRERGIPFTIPPAGTRGEDDYENNDDFLHATSFVPGTSHDLVLADEDWFQISVAPFTRLRARATFDPVDLDLDLELRAQTGKILDASRSVWGKESVDGVAGADGATWFLRASRGAAQIGVAGYKLDLLDLPLEVVKIGRTTLRRTTRGAPDVVAVSIGRAKVDAGMRLVVESAAKGGHGAVNDVRVVSPSGRVAVDFGKGRTSTGARVVVLADEDGAWRVEVLSRAGTSGGYTIATSFRR